ncbi:ThrA protein [Candidatus Pantoea carbekii]|uniref:Bifunctional aspartokinase/homoserine dehydrogenase n=1 Tax=Candidatus Pantoea carbekii TaxID=1235990 RepID=U3U2V5_9GAMM|nr:ThrA protein [Candidatus Pantoea carbekii]
MRVLKFGGTSVANAENFLRVAEIIEKSAQQEQVAIVLSAPANITNYLITIIQKTIDGNDILSTINNAERIFAKLLEGLAINQVGFDYEAQTARIAVEFIQIQQILKAIKLLRQCPDSIKAKVICHGQKLLITIMEALLQARAHKVTVIHPIEKLLAVGHYLESTIDIAESTRRISSIHIPYKNIILMAGLTAGSEQGELMILGRNGSDYSAAVLAACMHASCCEIWTDVDGVYTCDLDQVPNAILLQSISYQEAMEFSYFGAKILHPRTIALMAQFQIPCVIKNTTNPNESGTLISDEIDCDKNPIKGITSLKNMVMLNISGPNIMKEMINIAARILSSMSCAGISVIFITQSSSKHNISFCVSHTQQTRACRVIEQEFYLEFKHGILDRPKVTESLAIVSVIGDGIRTLRSISAQFFSALSLANVNIIAIAQGSCERSISVVINNNDLTIGMRVVHQILFSTKQIIEIFLIGVGGVGSALLEQLYRQKAWLKRKHIDLRVCGIIHTRTSLINAHGINLNNWKTELTQSNTRQFNLDNLICVVKENYLINPVIIDCTASQNIAEQYVDFLAAGFHVITPNKKANTSSLKYYKQLREVATKSHRKFLYDTNVGAGLPVIENLQNLMNAGDKLIKFSGILSGSLSFIFGKLDEGIPLSQATVIARELGFTEPDPRDDLSGNDVARKLLILAREAGYELELQDIEIEPLIPAKLKTISNVEEFMKHLPEIDNIFAIRVAKAHEQGKVLRFVGVIEETGMCKVKVDCVDTNDPFYTVKNGENALAFYSKYYHPIPLVLRGYGAGNAVTAAGVFADILRTLSWKLGV